VSLKVQKLYSLAFQKKVVDEITSGKYSIGEVKPIYEIGGSTTVQKWLEKFGKPHYIQRAVRIQMKSEADKIKKLEEEKALLEKALARSELRSMQLEGIIEVAEEHYQIDIKKNTTLKAQTERSERSGMKPRDTQ